MSDDDFADNIGEKIKAKFDDTARFEKYFAHLKLPPTLDFAALKFKPPVRSPVERISVAEFIAMKTLVMLLVKDMAHDFAGRTGNQQQAYVNQLAVDASEGIETATFDGLSENRTAELKSEAKEAINKILGGIPFPKVSGTN